MLHSKEGLLRSSDNQSDMDISTGKNYIINILRKCGMDRPLQLPSNYVLRDDKNAHNLLYGYISSNVPIVRHAVHGNVLPSDLELMDETVMKKILTRKSHRSVSERS